MEIYIVGGAVRDILLGVQPKDKDWVVVGATEAQMLDKGFIKVPASFPVFINPKTKQEYALARSEKKTSKGYHGFEANFSPDITLKEDLRRRDLTINSIAIDEHNNIIDPFNGQQDLRNRILRHTSEAFAEDPLRVIRLARFKAQLCDFNFSIATETKQLVSKIIQSGELNCLTKERLHIEFTKSLNNPKLFFSTLDNLNAIETTFPSIKKSIAILPDNKYFNSHIYTSSYHDEKITLCLVNCQNIEGFKKELLLTNKQYKLLKATRSIKDIIENKDNIDASSVYDILKQSNILRDKNLLTNALIVYKKHALLSKAHNESQIKLFERTINSLNNLDIKKVIAEAPKNDIKSNIQKLHIDTIKKQLKI